MYTIKESDNFNEHCFAVGTHIELIGIEEDADLMVSGRDPKTGEIVKQIVTLDDINFV